MAKGGKADKPGEDNIVNVCKNRRAAYDYELSDRIECGLALVGTEVKALRDGHANLEDAYARVENNEVWLYGCEIPEYAFGNRLNHEPKRARKLLLHRREIAKFAGKASERGFTLVPTRVYFKNGRAKVEIAVGKGKQAHDKRQSIKTNEAKRDIDRAMRQRRK